MERSVPWSDLPKDLWAMIGKKLDTHMDVYQFRSVCSSWRSSVPPPVSEFELGIGQDLIECRVYLLEPAPSSPEDPRCPPSREGWLIKVAEKVPEYKNLRDRGTASPEDPASPSREGWMVRVAEKVAEDEDLSDRGTASPEDPASPEGPRYTPSPEGWMVEVAEKVAEDEDLSDRSKVQLFNPLSTERILFKGGTFPSVLCRMDYRVTEIFAERYYPGGVRKVIMIPDSPWAVLEETFFVGIFGEGTLMGWKHGDEELNGLDYPNYQYNDLIAFKGQFYVVDRFGIVSWIDPSFKIVQFSPPVCCDGNGGDWKHLVESGGDLYVVDQYFDEESRNQPDEAKGTTGFKVYRLNQEWGKWDEIRNLGEVALFLGDHSCFSVSMKGFGGCKGNCIYFTDGRVQVFDMEDRSIKRALRSPDHLRILWPPPAWIAPNGFVLSPYSSKGMIF